YALGHPERLESGVASLDLFKIARFDFEAPDTGRFPCLRLAFDSLRMGGTAPAIMNAANEIAVNAFLDRKIGFTEIPAMIESVMNLLPSRPADTLETVIEADREARQLATTW